MIIAQIYDLVLFKRFYYLLILTYAFKKKEGSYDIRVFDTSKLNKTL